MTIPDGKAYALCKSLLCRQCGHLFADYRFSEHEMSNLYSDYRGSAYTALREKYEPGYEERNRVIVTGISYLAQIENFLNPFVPAAGIRVLDWGGDTGVNTPFAERRAFLHIFDPSAKEAEAQDAVSFTRFGTDRAEYDLIVLSNVLEHIPFPAETLQEILPFMTRDSVLYVEVPFETLQQSADGPPYAGASNKKHWHEHINFYTPQSMETLLIKNGFSVEAQNILDRSVFKENSTVSFEKMLQYACKRRPVG